MLYGDIYSPLFLFVVRANASSQRQLMVQRRAYKSECAGASVEYIICALGTRAVESARWTLWVVPHYINFPSERAQREVLG